MSERSHLRSRLGWLAAEFVVVVLGVVVGLEVDAWRDRRAGVELEIGYLKRGHFCQHSMLNSSIWADPRHRPPAQCARPVPRRRHLLTLGVPNQLPPRRPQQ